MCLEMAPNLSALHIRNRMLVDPQPMPSLPFILTAKYCGDELEFCNAILVLNFAWMRECEGHLLCIKLSFSLITLQMSRNRKMSRTLRLNFFAKSFSRRFSHAR
jgi:hypothetical protein